MTTSISTQRKTNKSGKHDYKMYFEKDGNKLIVSCARIYAHLQSCGITNPTGTVVLRYLMIDIDSHRTMQKWKNEDGSINYSKVHNHLSTKLSKICSSIEYITRSHGGKGIHLIIGFTALPLDNSTLKMQSVCSQIQNLIINILKEYGLGADEGARGLNRLFSTFRDAEKLLHHNNILTKNIEKQRNLIDKSKKIPYLINLLKACKKYAKKLELNGFFRLYNHKKVEVKVAKLFLYTLGLLNIKPMTKLSDNLKIQNSFVFKKISPGQPVTLTIQQLMHITGLSSSSLRELNFFSNEMIIALWDFDFHFDGKVTLNVRNVSTLSKRIARAWQVIHGYREDHNRMHPDLIEPCLVKDGERNFVICSWVLAYKWSGYEKEETLEMIHQLVKMIPNFESSRSCKESQLKSVVNSIYRYKEELFGINKNALPFFMTQVANKNKTCLLNKLATVGRLPGRSSDEPLQTNFTKYERKSNDNLIVLNSKRKQCKNNILQDKLKNDFCVDQKIYNSDLHLSMIKCEMYSYVRKDGFVFYEGKYYSLGISNVGKIVRTIEFEDYLYFYHNENLLEKHLKIYKRTIKYAIKDYHKLLWDEIELINSKFLYKANEIGADCKSFISAYLASNSGFSDNQFICSILSLKGKCDLKILNEACKISLEKGIFSLNGVKKFICKLSDI